MKSKISGILVFLCVVCFYACETSVEPKSENVKLNEQFLRGEGGVIIIAPEDSVDPSNGKKKPKPPTESGNGG